ncbi:MAG: PVC-type heme-binding CxxCH protein [Planctomycetota bacterium]
MLTPGIALLLAVCPQDPAPAQPRDLTPEFDLPEGLEVRLWAESPHLYNPAAIDVDEFGRIWVAEAVNYRRWDGRNPGREHPRGDRIVVLRDVDGDGRCDRSHVYAQDPDLVAPLGIAVIAGKVYVSCSPHLFVYEDTDLDGRADKREVFLTGFGGHDHDHGLHSIVAGPDGQLYFNVGNAGPHLVTDAAGWTLRSGSTYRGGGSAPADNKPGLVSDDGRTWTGGLMLRVGYDGSGLEVLGHNFRNNYELALDSFGNLYQTDNDDDGNGGCRTLWCLPGGNHGFFSADGSRSWRADQRPGQDNWTAHWHRDDPGVAPPGTRNGPGGPTGLCVYEGDLLERWLGDAVVNADAGARVVYAHRPAPLGAGVELELEDLLRPKEGRDDRGARWFRPSDVVVGTDEAIYVSDWYDPGVGGHAAGDKEAYGRILRIAPAGTNPQSPRYDFGRTAGKLAAFFSPAIHVRELARRALVEDKIEGTAALEAIATLHPDRNASARAIWALAMSPDREQRSKGLDAAYALDPAFLVRLMGRLPWTGETLGVLGGFASLPDAALGREIALLLRDVPAEQDLPLLLDLARGYDGVDRTYLEAFGLAAEGDEDEVYTALAAELGDTPSRWDARFEGLAWRLHPPSAAPAFLARALDPTLEQAARRRAIDALAFTGTREAAEAVLTVAQAGPGDLRAYATWWIRNRDTNDWRAFGLGQRVRTGDLADAELAWTSEVRNEGLVDVEVDVAGVDVLWLVVTDGGNGNSCDWADWIAPRFEGSEGTVRLAETSWIEAEAGWGSVRAGTNCTGGPLRVGSLVTADGIGTHARSRIAFAVPDGAQRFRAQAGPDYGGTSQSCGTSIEFQVWLTRPEAEPQTAGWERRMLDAALGLAERRAAAEALAADPAGALLLIRRAERGSLPDELASAVAAAIHTNPDLGVRALASEHFPRPGQPASYPSIPELLALDGDARRGRDVFLDRERAQCVTCHAYTLGDATVGGDIGPDLTRIREKYDAAALYDSILNPSAGIAFGYDAWLVETADGRLHSGFLLADGPTVVLKDTSGGRVVLDSEDVVDRVKQTVSTMPEGVALGIEPQELADLVAFLGAAPAPRVFGDERVLFDGTTLAGWTHHLRDGGRPEDVWSIEDGALICKGRPIGYLRTEETFDSFLLTLEWRFDPEKGAGNSGVLLRMHGEDKVWPRSIEAQLQSGNAGDIWNIDRFGMQVDPGRTNGRRTARLQPSSEKPLGDWNRYEILVDGPRVELRVNGVLQNTADWCEERAGHICLQSEGAEIHFRDIRLRPIVRPSDG